MPPARSHLLILATGLVAALAAIGIGISATTPVHLDIPAQGRPALGPAGAPTLALFEDYKCPACKAFVEESLPTLKAAAAAGKLRIVFLHRPFLGPDSTDAAIAAECVFRQRPAAFLAYHESLYAHQGPEQEQWAKDPLLTRLAADLDLDLPAWQRCRIGPEARAQVKADNTLYLKGRARYTPALYFNGDQLRQPTLSAVLSKMEQPR